jgi:hypothetical protein
MNPTAKAFQVIASLTLALTATLTSAAERRVTVYIDDAPYATDQAMTYEATCPSGKYRLRINQNDERVEFEHEGSTRTTVDLSTTPFGATFLEKELHGKFFSTCPKGGITVYFYGIEPKEGATLRPVKYRFTIGSNGVITRDDGLDEEDAQSINFWFLHKAQQ